MGLLKGLLLFGGLPVRPTTTRERSRGYQRKANNLQAEANEILEEQVRALEAMSKRLMATQGVADPRKDAAGVRSESTIDKIEKIARLHDLHKSGALSEVEFEAQKQVILGSI
jgi:hypothetical protein